MSLEVQRSGILLVDKPSGMTSHDVVSRVRRLAGTRKVGHAGTLDPLATGLLVLGLNSSTRLLTFLVGLDKEYSATIRLGASTPTDDAGSEPDRIAAPELLALVAEGQIRDEIALLTGKLLQVPSAVSAIKVDGQRAYSLVRAGEQVVLAARPVTVSEFSLQRFRRLEGFIEIDVRVACSSGTYIRALARDLGIALGVGGHLTALRRHRIGPFQVNSASELDGLDAVADLLTPATVARELFPILELTSQQQLQLSQGKQISVSMVAGGPVAAITSDGSLAGLVTIADGSARVLVNFPKDEVA